jgi:hypothetical protein
VKLRRCGRCTFNPMKSKGFFHEDSRSIQEPGR